ncbi:hypothetical protein BDW72DRAFT_213976 [Aspergillus terricola var. indicus]
MYSILLLGATGYTGTLCAKFIGQHYPANIHWCIGGRSEQSLMALGTELRESYPDRVQPEIELVELTKTSLESVTRKAKVVVNCVGPFHKLSTPMVEACARVGTHYLDFSTETLWIAELIEKYEDAARESGPIIIPGISSAAPADLIAGPSEIISAGKLSIKAMTPDSLITILDSFATWGAPWYLSGNSGSWALTSRKKQPRLAPRSRPLSQTLGYCLNPVLGPLTTFFAGPGNASIVHRSAAQNPELYGHNFQYKEHLPATGMWNAIFIHCFTKIVILLLWVPLVRGLVRKLMAMKANDLPDQEVLRGAERAEYRAVGGIGGLKGTGKEIIEASLLREGALYEFTALLTCVGARVLLGRKSKDSG